MTKYFLIFFLISGWSLFSSVWTQESLTGGNLHFSSYDEPAWTPPYLIDSHGSSRRRHLSLGRRDLERHHGESIFLLPPGSELKLHGELSAQHLRIYRSPGSGLYQKIVKWDISTDGHYLIPSHWRKPTLFLIKGLPSKIRGKIWVRRHRENLKVYPPRNTLFPHTDKKKHTQHLHLSHPSRSYQLAPLYPCTPIHLNLPKPTFIEVRAFREFPEAKPGIYEAGFFSIENLDGPGLQSKRWTARPEWRRHHRWEGRGEISQEIKWTPWVPFSGNISLSSSRPLWVRILGFSAKPWLFSDNLLTKDRHWSDCLRGQNGQGASSAPVSSLVPHRIATFASDLSAFLDQRDLNPLKAYRTFVGSVPQNGILHDELSDLLTRHRWHRDLEHLGGGSLLLPYASEQIMNPWGKDAHLRVSPLQVHHSEPRRGRFQKLSPGSKGVSFTLPPEPESRRLELMVGSSKEANSYAGPLPEITVEEFNREGETLAQHHLLWQDLYHYAPSQKSPSQLPLLKGGNLLGVRSIKLTHHPEASAFNVRLHQPAPLALRWIDHIAPPALYIGARQEASRRDRLPKDEQLVLESWSRSSKRDVFAHLLTNGGNAAWFQPADSREQMARRVIMRDLAPLAQALVREGSSFQKLGMAHLEGEIEKDETPKPTLLRAQLVRSQPGSQKEAQLAHQYTLARKWDFYHEGRRALENWMVWRHPTPSRMNRLGRYHYHQGSWEQARDLLSMGKKEGPVEMLQLLDYLEELNEHGSQRPRTPQQKFFSGNLSRWESRLDLLDQDLPGISLTPLTHWAHSRWKRLARDQSLSIKVVGPKWIRTRLRPIFQKGEERADIFLHHGIGGDLQDIVIPSHAPSNSLVAIGEELTPGRSWSKRWFIPEGEHTLTLRCRGRDLLLRLDQWSHPLHPEAKPEDPQGIFPEPLEQDDLGPLFLPPLTLNFKPEAPRGRALGISESTRPKPKEPQHLPYHHPTKVINPGPRLKGASDLSYPIDDLGPAHVLLGKPIPLDLGVLALAANALSTWPEGNLKETLERRLRERTDWRNLETPQQSGGHVFKPIHGWTPESWVTQKITEELGLESGGTFRLIFSGSEDTFSIKLEKKKKITLSLTLLGTPSLSSAFPAFVEYGGRNLQLNIEAPRESATLSWPLEAGSHLIKVIVPVKIPGSGMVLQVVDDEGRDLIYREYRRRHLLTLPGKPIVQRFNDTVFLRLCRWTTQGYQNSFRLLKEGEPLVLQSEEKEFWRISQLVLSQPIQSSVEAYRLQTYQETDNALGVPPLNNSTLERAVSISKAFGAHLHGPPANPKEGFPTSSTGTWQGGVAFSTGLAEEEEGGSSSLNRFKLFGIHRYHDPWKDNYHRSRLGLSKMSSGTTVATLGHDIRHDHLVLPLSSRWSGDLAIQKFPGTTDTARAMALGLELSRPIRWNPRLSRRPSFRLRWAYQELDRGHPYTEETLSPEVYSLYRENHALQATWGEQFQWIQAENSIWTLSARVLGNHGPDLLKPDQGWLRLRWAFHLQRSIWRPSLRFIQRVGDDLRSSSSSETVLGLEGWIFGNQKEDSKPMVQFKLDHRLQAQETRLNLEVSLFKGGHRGLRDHREGDPPFLNFWKNSWALEGAVP